MLKTSIIATVIALSGYAFAGSSETSILYKDHPTVSNVNKKIETFNDISKKISDMHESHASLISEKISNLQKVFVSEPENKKNIKQVINDVKEALSRHAEDSTMARSNFLEKHEETNGSIKTALALEKHPDLAKTENGVGAIEKIFQSHHDVTDSHLKEMSTKLASIEKAVQKSAKVDHIAKEIGALHTMSTTHTATQKTFKEAVHSSMSKALITPHTSFKTNMISRTRK